MDIPSTRELTDLLLGKCRELDEAQLELDRRTHVEAETARDYREERSKAYLKTEGTVGEREAQTEQLVGDLRYESHLAEGLAKSALELVRSKRTQLSALQTLAGAWREEAAYTRTGPA